VAGHPHTGWSYWRRNARPTRQYQCITTYTCNAWPSGRNDRCWPAPIHVPVRGRWSVRPNAPIRSRAITSPDPCPVRVMLHSWEPVKRRHARAAGGTVRLSVTAERAARMSMSSGDCSAAARRGGHARAGYRAGSTRLGSTRVGSL
jgi:hypothetical protein